MSIVFVKNLKYFANFAVLYERFHACYPSFGLFAALAFLMANLIFYIK